MPTISDLKDQARTLEQHGQFEKALTIYQHILKHLEGTPALSKVLPLYVKAGDLLHKMDREEEAVESYQTAAEHYAASGAAPRVTALCGKIIRLVPERRDVYTVFVRQLIDHGHVGSARDVLADYARYASMDRAIDTLDDLAGRPNSEVQPILERLLNSLEMEDESEQTAERLSSQLEEVTDSLAGELSGIPEGNEDEEDVATVEEAEEEAPVDEAQDDSEPLTPKLFDLDNMARQSSMHKAIRLEDEDEDEVADEVDDDIVDEQADTGADSTEVEESSGFDITSNVTPTMDGMPAVPDEAEEKVEDNKLDLLLADAVANDDEVESADIADTTEPVEVEGSEWKPDIAEPPAEESVAAQWAPEEELQPAARYPSDEYETPEVDDEPDDDEEEESADSELGREESDALDDAISRAVEDSHAFTAHPDEPTVPAEADDSFEQVEVEEKESVAGDDEPSTPEPARRPSRPPQIAVPQSSETTAKSPIMFGIGGFVIGALAGAGLTLVLVGGGSDNPPPTTQVEQPAAVVDTPATQVETPSVAAPAAVDPVAVDTSAVDTTTEMLVDSTTAIETETTIPVEASPDSTPTAAEADAETPTTSATVNPIIVQGMQIEEISEIEYDGRPGFRVVHLLEWSDPIVIEAVQDTSVTVSTFIQVDVTPPDTVVGIRRLDGYMVYASGVMPEDSLRSLMSRLVVGEQPNQ